LQVLDLVVFGITKRDIVRANHMESLSIQTKHVHQVMRSFTAVAVPVNIVKIFRAAGIGEISDESELLCKIGLT
jgi:hypothetical protein